MGTRQALANLELLFPDSIGEACFIDFHGSENARAVGGADEDLANLSPDEARNSFFAPTFELDKGEVYQAAPYVSPDTHEWVIANSTPIVMPDGSKPGIVHFEVTIESFRREAAKRSERFDGAGPRRADRPAGRGQRPRAARAGRGGAAGRPGRP